MFSGGSVDLAVTDFQLSDGVSLLGNLPAVTVWDLLADTSSSVGFSVNTNTPDSTLKSDRDVEHVHVALSGPGVTLDVE